MHKCTVLEKSVLPHFQQHTLIGTLHPKRRQEPMCTKTLFQKVHLTSAHTTPRFLDTQPLGNTLQPYPNNSPQKRIDAPMKKVLETYPSCVSYM